MNMRTIAFITAVLALVACGTDKTDRATGGAAVGAGAGAAAGAVFRGAGAMLACI
jgi:hypothetical protein